MGRHDMRTESHTLSHACARGLYAAQGKCQKNVRATPSVCLRWQMNGGLEFGFIRVCPVFGWRECLWVLEMTFFSSDEEGEHNVENFLLCSFAHHACSPFLQGFSTRRRVL